MIHHPPSQPKSSALKWVAIAGAVGVLVVLISCCSCLIFSVKQGDFARERAARVGSAAKLVALRGRLDRVYDGFPVEPIVGACSGAFAADVLPVVTYSGLAAFRRGDGNGSDDDSMLHLASTQLRGSDRPPDGLNDEEAFERIDTLFSSVRPLIDMPHLAVIRTADMRWPLTTFNVFTPGYYRGWLVVFDLNSGAALCAQPLTAGNSASVESGLGGSSDSVRENLVTNVRTAREQARTALSPTLRLAE